MLLDDDDEVLITSVLWVLLLKMTLDEDVFVDHDDVNDAKVLEELLVIATVLLVLMATVLDDDETDWLDVDFATVLDELLRLDGVWLDVESRAVLDELAEAEMVELENNDKVVDVDSVDILDMDIDVETELGDNVLHDSDVGVEQLNVESVDNVDADIEEVV